MEMLLKLILSDKGIFGAVFGAIIGGAFAIIGSLIAGLFTYLAVVLTLNNQKKNEYPQKLEILVSMLSEVESIDSKLTKHVLGPPPEPGVLYPVRKIDTKELERSLMVQAVKVDIKTYKYVSDAFSLYRKLGYSETITYTSRKPDDIKCGSLLQKYMNRLRSNIDSQIKSYTKKIE